MDKRPTLSLHEYRDEFSGARRRALPLSPGLVVMGPGPNAGCTGRLQRRALTQYSRLVFSVLDGLRAGRYCVGTRGARNFQGHGAAR
jgi:hypothetical protein